MKYILTFLSLCLMANFVTAQSSKIVYLKSDDTKVPVYFDTAAVSREFSPLILVDGRDVKKEMFNTIPTDSIESVNVISKNDTIIDNQVYKGVIRISLKEGAKKYLKTSGSLLTLIKDSLQLNPSKVICTVDGKLVTTQFKDYLVNIDRIGKITILPYNNVTVNKEDNTLLVRINTKTITDIQGFIGENGPSTTAVKSLK
ncbi:hypothetical protein [Rhizosphaericola mali]|nr:hypothetical protein [Rhizosphaericola mali]